MVHIRQIDYYVNALIFKAFDSNANKFTRRLFMVRQLFQLYR